MENIIEMQGINKSYGKGDSRVEALKDISLTVKRGEFLAILGPSGSGKSTLMNLIGLMDTIDSGTYLLDGLDVLSVREKMYAGIRNRKIGFIFQKFNLISKYTAIYNVALPLLLRGSSYRAAKVKAREILEQIGLGDRGHHRPNQLSGGQLQRVAIARALVGDCSLILADEPTGALDQKTGLDVIDTLIRLNREGKTIIMITHDNNLAMKASRIIKIEDGRILQKSH